MNRNRRIAIVGGGPVGMALALALQRRGMDTEVFEARTRDAVRRDARVLALSHGSVQILDWLGAWRPLCAQRVVAPISSIHVSHRGALGRTRLRADELGVEALGHVVPAQELIGVLDGLVAEAGIDYRERAQVGVGETATLLAEHDLIAWAEGAVDPRVAEQRNYDQHAVLCQARVDRPHGQVAWERFTDEGPVALLPFGHEVDAYAVVLACAGGGVDAVLAMNDAEFLTCLQKRFGTRLTLCHVGPRTHYPLGLRWRASPVAERQVWLGNAAQTLHPVAGQGFNLALRDVWQLAEVVTSADDITEPAVLRRYARGRVLDRRGVIGFTDSLIDLFGNDFGPIRHARGAGLLALDVLPPVRHFLARRMMFGARSW